MNRVELAKYIEGTLVKNIHTENEIKKSAELAKEYQLGAVVTMPCYTAILKETLKGSGIIVGGVSAFPWGASTTRIKIDEALDGIKNGAQEIDTVMNLNLLMSGKYKEVVDEIRALKESMDNIPLKVIIEASMLDEDMIVQASKLVVEGGADYIKTCTGFNGESNLKMIKLIKSTVGDQVKIKAAGGIRTAEIALSFIEAGASRLGIGFDNAIKILDSMD